MHAYTIGSESRADDIIHRMHDEFQFLEDEGVKVDFDLYTRGKFTFLNCCVEPESADNTAVVRHYIASALSDVIVDKFQNDWVRKIIRTHYYYFAKDEQNQIQAFAERHLQAQGRDHLQAQEPASRRARILHRIRDFLDQSSELVVEGFVNFRLRDYVDELENAVDRAVDEFLMEREQSEFIRLLRYFVEVQEPRTAEVHVLMHPGGLFKLTDREGNTLQSEVLEEFVIEMVESSEVSHDDLLISALITISPRRVILHGPMPGGWEDALKTIHGVFLERVDECTAGCGLCQYAAAGSPQEPS